MSQQEIRIPDLGDFDEVEVVEVQVAAGDEVAAEQALITLETDKATMDVPSPVAGRIVEVLTTVGAKVAAGAVIAGGAAGHCPATGEGFPELGRCLGGDGIRPQ